MTKWKPTPFTVVRYWHPRKGGWYHAELVKLGRKWAVVRPLLGHNGLVVAQGNRKRVAVADLREAVL